ncbi:hypothetical protein [Actinoplanes sp. ATCC 53533]|uniref:hypothetical protein n=1 Tax=Actinoplanes sp. ATCC 53533 TaxID=1288362 RepID=UPI0018F57342|nr:hypothetical protein [Actinoplanes sp. ATCC 53533]
MRRIRWTSGRQVLVVVSLAAVVAALGAVAPSPAAGAPRGGLAEQRRLADRRFVAIGDRAYEVGAEDGRYPATGWHIRGEMGGFWSAPIKLLDGLWFAVDGQWLSATRFTSGHGFVQMELAGPGGLRVHRTDVVPDGGRAALVGLTFSGPARRIALSVDAHSELLSAYPWGWTTPSQETVNLPDTGGFDGRNLVFRETAAGERPHEYAAVVGSALTPDSYVLGPGHRGPQEPAVVCPVADPAPPRCDDGPYGRGTGGRLTYTLQVPRAGRTVWFAVAGSDDGVAAATAESLRALRDPAQALRRKLADRVRVAARTRVDLPGDRLLQHSVEWSKQNLADSVQEARDLQVFASREGTLFPPPAGTVDAARWVGAGWPDYPWIFATDAEYTAFASVAAGQFEPIKAHLRALREISEIVNGRSGKVVHEVTPDGQVYFGANDDPGNTDESAKFPSTVALIWRWTGDDAFRDEMYDFAVRAMRHVTALDADADGWPEGLGNVERPGMGGEKLDVAVYTIRGLRDLADLAAARGDRAVAGWATAQAERRERAFEQTWWYGGDADAYADSLSDPGDVKVFQRHWTGLTPVAASCPAGRSPPPATRTPRWPSGSGTATPASSASSTPAAGRPARRPATPARPATA